jgi:hypothetical protein
MRKWTVFQPIGILYQEVVEGATTPSLRGIYRHKGMRYVVEVYRPYPDSGRWFWRISLGSRQVLHYMQFAIARNLRTMARAIAHAEECLYRVTFQHPERTWRIDPAREQPVYRIRKAHPTRLVAVSRREMREARRGNAPKEQA